VEPGRITAQYRDGILHIMAGRSEAAKPRKIEIN
jgi:HSP20 family molecular chaperone IbpA